MLQSKAIAIENDLRATLRNFGLKVGMVGAVKFEARIRELVEIFPDLIALGQDTAGEYFFQKRAPVPRPDWIEICSIPHAAGNIIDFPIVRDLATLLWVVNLGCIDLNPWYARCDDVYRPDYLHFDLDPVPPAKFGKVLETAKILHRALDALGMLSVAKTTGSKGMHVYVPIVRGPLQKAVWAVAKRMAKSLEQLHPGTITAEYRIEKRPPGRVLVDYNQNAWGRTLASVYSVRPKPRATVSAPVTWAEVERASAWRTSGKSITCPPGWPAAATSGNRSCRSKSVSTCASS